MYISHNLPKIVSYIGDYILGYTFLNDRPIYVTSGLDEYGEKEVELHEVLHQIYKEIREYINRIKTWCVLRSLGITPKYH